MADIKMLTVRITVMQARIDGRMAENTVAMQQARRFKRRAEAPEKSNERAKPM